MTMAGEIPDLIARVRTGTGKGAARQSRRNGDVPGIVYGGGADPLPIDIDYNYLLKHLKEGRFLSKLFNLKVEGHDDVRVICRGVQRDVVKDKPVHVDLMRLRRTSRINLFIHVDFINHDKAPGLKKGGTLVVVRPEVELEVTAGARSAMSSTSATSSFPRARRRRSGATSWWPTSRRRRACGRPKPARPPRAEPPPDAIRAGRCAGPSGPALHSRHLPGMKASGGGR
jgi:large subunit ribosomal protein L25